MPCAANETAHGYRRKRSHTALSGMGVRVKNQTPLDNEIPILYKLFRLCNN